MESNIRKRKEKNATYMREYRARPEVKAKNAEDYKKEKEKNGAYMREYMKKYIADPEVKAKRAKYMREYKARPYVKAKIEEERKKNKEKRAVYQKAYRKRPYVIVKRKVYMEAYRALELMAWQSKNRKEKIVAYMENYGNLDPFSVTLPSGKQKWKTK